MSAVAARMHASPILRWLVRLAMAAGVFLVLAVAAWLIVPHVVRTQLETHVTEALGRKITVEAIEFNPFPLKLTLHKIAVAGRAGAPPLIEVDEAVADVSSASLWHWAPVLDAVKLVHPAVSIARDRNGRYDVQDLIDLALAAPRGPPPAFSLNNIEIENGTIAFDDALAGRKHRMERLEIAIPFLSSLPYETEIRVTPHFAGAVNGSHFALAGSMLPFGEHREASIDVDLDGISIRDYLAYLPMRPRVDLTGGALTTRLRVVFVPEERKLEVRGEARIDGLALTRHDGTPLAGADRLSISLDRVDVIGRDAYLGSIELDGARMDLRRLRDGSLEIAAPSFDAQQSASENSQTKPWSVSITKAALARGSLDITDEAAGFHSSLADVAAEFTNFSTKAGTKAHAKLSFVSADRIATFKGEADVDPLALAARGTFDLTKFRLASLFPYYDQVLAVDVQQGLLDFAGHFALDRDGSLRISQSNGAIDDLELAYPGNKVPFWRCPSLTATGIDVDVRGRSVKIADLASHSAVMKFARDQDGSMEVARLVKTTAATGTSSGDQTWTLTLGKVAVDRATIDVEDRMQNPVVRIPIRDLTGAATDLSNARGARSSLSVRARIGNRGQAAWTGTLVTNPLAATGRVDVSGFELVTVRPYVESHINVSVTGGALAAKGTLALDVPHNAAVKAAWQGDVAITDFAALDKSTASDFVRFKRLALEGIDAHSEPFRVAVDRIGVEDYYARLVVYDDGTLNATRLMTPGSASYPSGEPPADRRTQSPSQRAPLPVTIGRIEFARGYVNYSDFFVHPNFSANLTDVTGSVTRMSGEQAGDIAIAARVDRSAPVEISGRIHPFAKELSLDITAKARDVDLPPLTPYSVKYAGYGIEKGKLTFDVRYRVDNRRLTADNRLVLDQLTFNPQHMDSETATKLPVLLAVALLKDSRGVINIELPIGGSLDDPQFSVGNLVIRVIVNLITKAATAPFALLSAAFGHGEELSVVPFAPGSAALDDDARKRIDTLGKALSERPALKLDIGGRADAAIDREALRHAAVESAMKREKMKSLASSGTAPASVDLVTVGADERTRWLAAAYRESTIKERPRNAIGMLKDLPPEEMESMLLADAKVDNDALRLLANARAQAVKDALVAKDIAGERLFLTVPRLSDEAKSSAGRSEGAASGPPSRVDLALR